MTMFPLSDRELAQLQDMATRARRAQQVINDLGYGPPAAYSEIRPVEAALAAASAIDKILGA